MRVVPAVAVLVTGLALYLSRGVLDQVPNGAGLMRVALLPPWQALAGFTALAGIGLLWLSGRAAPRRSTSVIAPRLGPLVLPLFGLTLLAVPYLPFVPDAVPALQILAGPVRAVVWLAIAAQFTWVLWQSRLIDAGWLQSWTVGRLAIGIGVLTALVSATAAVRLIDTVLYPAGDEPHYLVIAQSLWRDGDLAVENNHTRLDYKEYFEPELAPHYVTRGADNAIYSIHPIGLPVLMAPVYAAGGYHAVVAAMVILAAIAAAVMWLATVSLTNAVGAATFAWAAVALTAPFLFNSFAVYPEIAAAFAVVMAYTRAVDSRPSWKTWLVTGVMCAALPWLGTKYAPMSAALVAVAMARIIWPTADALRAAASRSFRTTTAILVPAAALVGPYVLSLAGWFLFFEAFWGSPWPQAPYGQLVQTDVRNLIFGAPGLLFDQEYGLLPYAPVYILAVPGLWLMWRAGGDGARRAVEIVLTFSALLATVGAFRIWWGGSAVPGRPIASGLLLLAMPIAVAFQKAPATSAQRAAQHLLLSISVAVAGVLLFAQNGFLILNGRDGTSSLLEYLSPRWPAWAAAPSFIYHEPLTALAHTAAWLLAAALAAACLTRVRVARAGVASLIAIAVCAGALLLGALVVPALPATPAWPGVNVRARARAAVLDEFDAVARPIGLAYAPLGLVGAATIASHAALEVTPGSRTEAQPTRVVHNGRFSLPAGRYRLEIDWNGVRSAETLGLQVGRLGEPWRTWQVEPRPGERWSAEFALPVDAGFVGLRASPELEGVIARATFVPLAIVDAFRRPRLPIVLGAAQANGGDYFYSDENVLPEDHGFWVRGGRTTRVTIQRANAAGPLKLRLNSGLIKNRLRVFTGGWSRVVVLEPKQPGELEIPVENRALVTLDLHAQLEFIPRELDPTSRDPRPLGIWVELVPP